MVGAEAEREGSGKGRGHAVEDEEENRDRERKTPEDVTMKCNHPEGSKERSREQYRLKKKGCICFWVVLGSRRTVIDPHAEFQVHRALPPERGEGTGDGGGKKKRRRGVLGSRRGKREGGTRITTGRKEVRDPYTPARPIRRQIRTMVSMKHQPVVGRRGGETRSRSGRGKWTPWDDEARFPVKRELESRGIMLDGSRRRCTMKTIPNTYIQSRREKRRRRTRRKKGGGEEGDDRFHHKTPESSSALRKIVSLTAAKTKRILEVSVA